jgi:hypothetical protein
LRWDFERRTGWPAPAPAAVPGAAAAPAAFRRWLSMIAIEGAMNHPE